MKAQVLIIDFGSQVTQLIARRVREAGIYTEVKPYDISKEELISLAPKAIILSGGPSSVTEVGSPKVTDAIFALQVPIFGICYGQQLICQELGGKVESSNHREFGRAYVELCGDSQILLEKWAKGAQQEVWMSHGDRVESLPPGFKVIGKSENAPYAFVANDEKKIYGVQFHPEVSHSKHGGELISHFLFDIAGCKQDWNMGLFLDHEIEKIRQQVGDSKVLCAVSGGVDSTVVASLLHRAIGDKLIAVFVDTGLLKKESGDFTRKIFKDDLNIPLIYIDASKIFLERLKGVDDPEAKRKIIGKSFIDMFEEEAKKHQDAKFLAQGTIYSDVIESAKTTGSGSVTIKSHHNVGGLPERMNLQLVEPIRDLFKWEVRNLGRELEITQELLGRHPFPGPGLAIRVLGEVTFEKVAILQQADAIYEEEIRKEGIYDEIWQAAAILLPVKSVGVMGDGRTYEYVLALRAVTSIDGMTADFFDFSHSFLSRVCNKIINNVKGINRVVYDISSKPPATIEWE